MHVKHSPIKTKLQKSKLINYPIFDQKKKRQQP